MSIQKNHLSTALGADAANAAVLPTMVVFCHLR